MTWEDRFTEDSNSLCQTKAFLLGLSLGRFMSPALEQEIGTAIRAVDSAQRSLGIACDLLGEPKRKSKSTDGEK